MKNIELNSLLFNEIITREDLFKIKTQEEIYSYYMGENISELGVRCSPLREDNIPSFNLYFHRGDRNILMFKDYATGDCGDCIILVQKLFGISYKEAIHKIAFDLGIIHYNATTVEKKEINYSKIQRKETVNIGVKSRLWRLEDKIFWQQFNISKKTLIKYNVTPISHIFFNENGVKVSTLAYAYIEFKDGKPSYKIYKPYETKENKWLTNTDSSIHQGYTQLAPKGELLILTKSLKDVMSIVDSMQINAVGLQSESVLIKDSVLNEYKQRFTHIICLFDNDEAGVKLTNKFIEKYNLPFFFIIINSNSINNSGDNNI